MPKNKSSLNAVTATMIDDKDLHRKRNHEASASSDEQHNASHAGQDTAVKKQKTRHKTVGKTSVNNNASSSSHRIQIDKNFLLGPDKNEIIFQLGRAIMEGRYVSSRNFVEIAKRFSAETNEALNVLQQQCRQVILPAVASSARLLLGLMYQHGLGVEKNYSEAVLLFQQEAEFENINAINNLACLYLDGQVVEQNYTKAFALFKKAADLGNPSAMGNLGSIYQYGLGVEQNDSEAIALFKKAAESGSSSAMYRLAYMYENGLLGLEQNDQNAILFYEKAAALGHTNAMNMLASMYCGGRGVEQDFSKVFLIYQTAAQLGNPTAISSLAYMYAEGLGVVQNERAAFLLSQQAAALGSVNAMNHLAYAYRHGKGTEQDYSKAILFYRRAIELEDSSAMYDLGAMYDQGLGVEKNVQEAISFYRKAAALGNTNAMNNLADKYCYGIGVEQDCQMAISLFSKAVEGGNPCAMFNLAHMYLKGMGVERDYSQAKLLFERAAALGDSDAMHSLAYMYFQGQGVEKDDSQAALYFERAAALGHSDAMNHLAYMYANSLGVEQDYLKAISLYDQSMALGNLSSMDDLKEIGTPEALYLAAFYDKDFTFMITLVLTHTELGERFCQTDIVALAARLKNIEDAAVLNEALKSALKRPEFNKMLNTFLIKAIININNSVNIDVQCDEVMEFLLAGFLDMVNITDTDAEDINDLMLFFYHHFDEDNPKECLDNLMTVWHRGQMLKVKLNSAVLQLIAARIVSYLFNDQCKLAFTPLFEDKDLAVLFLAYQQAPLYDKELINRMLNQHSWIYVDSKRNADSFDASSSASSSSSSSSTDGFFSRSHLDQHASVKDDDSCDFCPGI